MAITSRLITKRPNPPRITLFEPRETVSHVWEKHQKPGLPMVHVYHGEIWDFAFNVDAIVVPMSGAATVSERYTKYFDPSFERRLRSVIRAKDGKNNVGQAVIVAMPHPSFPYVICVPVVRTDGVSGNEPTNAYVAMRAVLELWRFGRCRQKRVRNLIEAIAVPMLAPETGSFSVDTVAKEQLRAIEELYTMWLSIPRRPTHLSLVTDARKS